MYHNHKKFIHFWHKNSVSQFCYFSENWIFDTLWDFPTACTGSYIMCHNVQFMDRFFFVVGQETWRQGQWTRFNYQTACFSTFSVKVWIWTCQSSRIEIQDTTTTHGEWDLKRKSNVRKFPCLLWHSNNEGSVLPFCNGNDHVTTVSSGENSPYSTSVPDHFELVYTAQNNFTLTFTLNYFFPPNRLLTSGAGATKKLPEGNQHNLSISCIYKGSSHPSSECDPQITLKTRKLKTMSKYLKIAHA